MTISVEKRKDSSNNEIDKTYRAINELTPSVILEGNDPDLLKSIQNAIQEMKTLERRSFLVD